MSLTRSYDQDSWSLEENGNTVLTVRETEENGQIMVYLSGELRSDAALIFNDELVALMTIGKDVVLDCGELTYIAHACQDALLSTQQTADHIARGSLFNDPATTEIYAEFEKSNLHELLMIE